jgi:hypothetical protein
MNWHLPSLHFVRISLLKSNPRKEAIHSPEAWASTVVSDTV